MAINDLPILSALRTKMQWHQERQRVLAENISNSNTPNFKPRDLVEPKFDNKGSTVSGSMGSLAMLRTSSSHIGVSGGGCLRQRQISQRQSAGRNDRHARGAAVV